MASSNLAPAPQRKKHAVKRKEMEIKICKELKEIFKQEFEDQVLAIVAQACDYSLEESINTLLKMNETKENNRKESSWPADYDSWVQEELLGVAEKSKSLVSDEYYSSEDENFNEYQDIAEATANLGINNNKKEKATYKVTKEAKTSLCGLKIQYHPKKSKYHFSNIDDDTDVVIENESQSSSSSSRSHSPDQKKSTDLECNSSWSTKCTQKATFPQSQITPSQTRPPTTPSHTRPLAIPSQILSPIMPSQIQSPTIISQTQSQPSVPGMSASFHNRIMGPINDGYKILILMRGMPGSGKSFLARSIVKQVPGATLVNHVFSADDYFVHSGVYRFNPNHLPMAHTSCQTRSFEAMKDGRSPIIIDNTNTQIWEMQAYVQYAVNYGYIIETLEPENRWSWKARELEKKNTHGVPKHKIEAMLDRYERNITGDYLIRSTKSKYKPNCTPPKMRSLPPISRAQIEYIQKRDCKPEFLALSATSFCNRRMRVPKIPATVETNEEPQVVPSVSTAEPLLHYQETFKNNLKMDLPVQFDSKESTFSNNLGGENIDKKRDYSTKETTSTSKINNFFENLNIIEEKVNSMRFEKNIKDKENSFAESNQFEKKEISENKLNCASSGSHVTETSETFMLRTQFEKKLDSSDIVNRLYSSLTTSSDSSLKNSEAVPSRLPSSANNPSMIQPKEDDNEKNIKTECSEIKISQEESSTAMTVKTISDAIEQTDCQEEEFSSSTEVEKNNEVEVTATITLSDCKDFAVFIDGKKCYSDYNLENKINEKMNDKKEEFLAEFTKKIVSNDGASDYCTTKHLERENEEITASDDNSEQNTSETELLNEQENISPSKEKEEILRNQDESIKNDPQESKGHEINSNTVEDERNVNEQSRSPVQSDNSSNKDSSFEFLTDNLLSLIDDREDISDLEWANVLSSEELDKADSPTVDERPDKPVTSVEDSDCAAAERTSVTLDSNDAAETTVEQKIMNKVTSQREVREIKDDSESNINNETETKSLKNQEDNFDVVAKLLEASSEFHLISLPGESTSETDENTEKQDANKPVYSEQMKQLQPTEMKEKTIDLDLTTKKSSSRKFLSSASGNVSKIDWSESPFPVDSTDIHTSLHPPKTEEKCQKSTVDSSTYTDPFDFNVAYFNGIDGYKVLNAVNRDINDPNLPIENREEHVPIKPSLNKGTMTNKGSILCSGVMFDFHDDQSEKLDMSAEILERFSHWSPSVILEIYQDVCKSNFDYAVDYISNIEKIGGYEISDYSYENDLSKPDDDNLDSVQDRSSGSTSPEINAKMKKENMPKKKKNKKKKLTSEKLHLLEELQSKIQINEESYPSHTLKVKRWKNREFDNVIEDCLPNEIDALEQEDAASCVKKIPTNIQSTNSDNVFAEKSKEKTSSNNDLCSDSTSDNGVVVELNVGFDCIKQLEEMFGGGEFDYDGIHSVIHVPKSMAQQLHALWIESMNNQYSRLHQQLDLMIAKDAEYAKSLMNQPQDEAAKPKVPNLKEIMDMEMALATYKNDKQKQTRELPHDIAQRVTQDTLYEIFSDFDRKTINELYEAHDRNFEETYQILEENVGNSSGVTLADVLKKRKHLIDELHKESYSISSSNLLNEAEASGTSYSYQEEEEEEEEMISYDKAMRTAYSSRVEAQRQLHFRNENFKKAHQEYRKKNPEVAAYYSEVARLHSKNMERANEEAATAYLAAQVHANDPDKQIDLHYLHVPEAIQALHLFIDSQLDQMVKGARKEVFVVTGKGTHSINGQSRIKPAIAKVLNQRSIRFSEMETNAGVLRVILKKT